MRALLCWLVLTSSVAAPAQDVAEAATAATPVVAKDQGSTRLRPAPATATLDDLLRMPAALREAFHQQVLDHHRAPTNRIERMVDFVFSPAGMGMRYDESATYTVAQSWDQRRANCIGFTLLFLALAREAGLSARAQEIPQTLIWQQSGTTLYRNSHVNLRLQTGPRRYTVDVARNFVISVGDPVAISGQRLLAHYHNNIAIKQMAQGRIDAALTRMEATLRLDPDYPVHWGNTGVIRLRSGDEAGAETAYRHALALDADEYGTLFNLVQLYDSRGDKAAAALLRERLTALQKKDPLYQFLLATRLEREGAFKQAIEHYRQAIHQHRNEHRFHAALARAYLASGDRVKAERALARAKSLSEGTIEARYAAELAQLRNMPGNG
ncbi:MAG: tetratricopeptide repeat protein [Xanthomonadales bacterium]|nr:tetratricopeptide repeat protein [Xanthomonadales bacterium]